MWKQHLLWKLLTPFMLLLTSLGQAGLQIQDLMELMSPQELAENGLSNLTPENQAALNCWLNEKCPYYYVGILKKIDATQLDWCSATAPFAPKLGNDLTPDNLDGLPMQWPLAVCAVFRDETPYLREWIEFYKLMGAQHFYLYNNLSNDKYLNLLEPYIKTGEVELFEWPVTPFGRNQCYCYSHAVKVAAGKARWLAIVDTDEFIFPLIHKDLVSFLAEFEHPYIGGVTASWRNYGTSNLSSLPKDGLLTELLTHRGEYTDHVKTIVKPHRVVDVVNPHWAIYKGPCFAVDETYARIAHHSNPSSPANKIRCNHYYTRDEAFYYGVKMPRCIQCDGSINGAHEVSKVIEEFRIRFKAYDNQLNQIEDRAIYRFVPALKERLAHNPSKTL